VVTATFTELLRHPNEVVRQTDNGAVRITRRDAEDLVLLRATDLEGQDKGIALASQIMRASFAAHGDMAQALKSAFSWAAVFAPEDLQTFASEIEPLVWAAVELGAYGRLRHAIESWRGTAEALAEGIEPLSSSQVLPESGWLDASEPI